MPEPPRLDDRQLLVELQSLGVRVLDETDGPLPGRRGGAGPSDALFLWVRGLPLTVPSHAAYVDASPYTVRVEGGARRCTATTSSSARSRCRRARASTTWQTADGVPYWKIALLHLDSIASTVVQKCIYWDTPEQCGFCGIELTRGEQTVPVKTPAQLAEVCTAARDFDHAVDVDADHRLAEPARPRRDLHQSLRGRDQGGVRAADPGPVRAAGRPARARRGAPRGRRRGRHPLRDVRSRGARAGRAGQGAVRDRGLLPHVGARGRGVRARRRDDLRAARHGRAAGADHRGLPAGDRDGRLPVRRAAAAGAGDADGGHADAGSRLRRRGSTREVAAMLADAGFDHLDAKAGCARCQACSGLSAWERVLRREDGGDVHDLFVGRRTAERRRSAVGRGRARRRTSPCAGAVFVEQQGCSTATTATRATTSAATLHAVAVVDGAVVGTVRLYPLGAGLWKGDRLAVLPDARVHRLGGSSWTSRCARPARSAARGWSRRCSCPTCASSSGWAGSATASRRPTAASCTSRWRSRCARPVSGRWRGPTATRRRAAGASWSARVSSKRPQGAQARPRRVEGCARRLRVLVRARRAGSRSSGRSAASARARRRPGAGARRGRASRRRPRPRSSAAASRRCRASRRRARRGRAPARRPRRAPRRRSRSALGARSRSAVKKSLVSLMYRPSSANAASSTSPGGARRRAAGLA